MNHEAREPVIRIARRPFISRWKAWLIRLIAIVIALVVCGCIIFAMTKLDPFRVYGAMLDGAFGSSRKVWQTVRDIMLLLCIAIGLAPAFKMRFWNIGAEGQVLIGGIMSAACMIYIGDAIPNWLLLIVMFVASAIGGAIWGFIPAAFKARWNTNETLFTLMMNYIAIQLTSYCVSLWENPKGSNSIGIINQATNAGWFPKVFGQQYTLNVIIVLLFTIIMFVYLRYSKQGYEISVVGESENTAKYAGINVKRVIQRTMLVSGGVCGIAGFIAVAGASHTISTSTAGGRGFTAIIIAWLAKFNTFVMVAVTLLLVFLERGATEIASRYDLNSYASQIITGVILFFILGSEFFINYQLKLRSKAAAEEKEA